MRVERLVLTGDAGQLAECTNTSEVENRSTASTHLAEGESVVVIAGAGGVGSLAVQLAKRWGAGRVIATASSPEKHALCEQLGADATVDPALAEDDPKAFTARAPRGHWRQEGGHCPRDDRPRRLRRLAVRRA